MFPSPLSPAFSLVLLLLAFLAAPLHSRAQSFPPPPALGNTNLFGAQFSRSMTLLTSSTSQKKHRVKVLVYGQSISEQTWWMNVRTHLLNRFPNAELTVEERAIGGFDASKLIKASEYLFYPHYPDLVLFHDYGSHIIYEDMITRFRRRTTAEVGLQNDHVTPNQDPFHDLMSDTFIPNFASKLGFEFMDIRTPWKTYLSGNNYPPSQLLSDNVHLNFQGNYLLAELIKPHLVFNPAFGHDPYGLVRTLHVGTDIHWTNGSLIVPFEGNRVDLIPANPLPGGTATSAQILLDGQPPSTNNACFYFTAPGSFPWGNKFSPLQMGSDALRVEENWTLTVTSVSGSGDSTVFSFNVSGSVTGPDGSGTNTVPFRSNSGRVTIDPADWWRTPGSSALQVGNTLGWSAARQHGDIYSLPNVNDPAREFATTVAQGFSNGHHTLQIVPIGGTNLPLKAVRVFRPLRDSGVVVLRYLNQMVSETAGSVQVAVARVGGTAGSLTVHYATSNATALAGTDYMPASGSFTWNNGQTGTKTFNVPLTDNVLEDGNRAFTVHLTGDVLDLTLVDSTVTIVDDESLPATTSGGSTGGTGTGTGDSTSGTSTGGTGDSTSGTTTSGSTSSGSTTGIATTAGSDSTGATTAGGESTSGATTGSSTAGSSSGGVSAGATSSGASSGGASSGTMGGLALLEGWIVTIKRPRSAKALKLKRSQSIKVLGLVDTAGTVPRRSRTVEVQMQVLPVPADGIAWRAAAAKRVSRSGKVKFRGVLPANGATSGATMKVSVRASTNFAQATSPTNTVEFTVK